MLRSQVCCCRRLFNKVCATYPSNAPDRLRVRSTFMTQTQSKTNSTVDKDDVERHSKLMEVWWDPDGPQGSLHSYNLIRIPFIRDGLVQSSDCAKSCTPLAGQKILDVGCGGGIVSEALANLGAEVTGIDASKKLVDLAQSHACNNPRLQSNMPSYHCTPIEEHAPKYESYYDGVVASEIIEHVDNSKKELFVRSCVHALKPGGRIFFTTPTRTQLAKLSVIFMAENVLRIVPRGTHQFDKFTTPTELTFLLERNGCQVEMVLGVFYDFVRNKWSFIKNTSLCFALQAVRHSLQVSYYWEMQFCPWHYTGRINPKQSIGLLDVSPQQAILAERKDSAIPENKKEILVEEKLRYIAVRPNSSTSTLRHKVWFLLDLPDYCEEVIVLKNHREMEIPLAALRKGNDPTHPYILEVYLPEKLRNASSNKITNMLTMGNEPSMGVVAVPSETSSNITNEKSDYGKCVKGTSDSLPPPSQHYRTTDIKRSFMDNKSDLSSRLSSSSLINKLNGRKSRDNLTNVLLKLQNDLTNLTSKLSSLETRVQPTLN